MTLPTITWTSKTGKTITATPAETMPATWLHVTVDGKAVGDGHLVPASDARVAAIAGQLTAAGLTHVLICGKLPIGVTAVVAAEIAAAQQAVVNRPPTLESQRRSLVDALGAANDVAADAAEAAYGEDTGRGWGKVAAAEQAIKAARQALADFDAAHPDVVAKIEADRRAASERFLAAD